MDWKDIVVIYVRKCYAYVFLKDFYSVQPHIFKNLFIFYWRIIALQNFAVFCQTSTWISHRYTYIPSLLKLSPISLPTPPLSLGWYRAPVWVSWATQQIPIGSLFYIWYRKFPCYSFHTTHPVLPSPHVRKSILYVCFSIKSTLPFPCQCLGPVFSLSSLSLFFHSFTSHWIDPPLSLRETILCKPWWNETFTKEDIKHMKILKSRPITLLTKVHIVKAMVFSRSHVQKWELVHKEGRVSKNWCFQTVVLKKMLESPLDFKEIKPVNPKGNQPWIFIGRTDAEAEAPILWPPDAKNQLLGKDPDPGKDWGQEEKGMTEDEMGGWHHQLKACKSEQTPGDTEGQGSLACCSPWGRKELDTTERLNNNNNNENLL